MTHTACRILIVDDEPANLVLLQRILRNAGYENLITTTDAAEVGRLMAEAGPDLVLLDLHMPGVGGLKILRSMRSQLDGADYLPVLVLTADATRSARERALNLGAKDFLTKPFDNTEVLLRVKNLLDTRLLHLELRDHNRRLEEEVGSRTADLKQAICRLEEAQADLHMSREETITRLAIAAEFRDDDTAQHVHRMSRYCALLAHRAGEDTERCDAIRVASVMHDVGKIGMPDSILLKPGRLTPQERVTMEQHAEIGHRILDGSRSELLQLAAAIALSHHERVDGNGYPHRLRRDDIPLEARIATVADVFDALTTDRVYRRAFSMVEALRMMRAGQGTQFDTDLLELFFASLDEVTEIRQLHLEEARVESLGGTR